ncbi:MAG: ABC transporter ATP-binding protein [Candidatus Lernaella stagnicola]|nr:ABC transporter ATP-binding protein [Candidatus Lernaella stagnicola]
MILTEDLTKHYGKLVAVNHVNLEVQPGEIFGFLGPNGAGKTTTIKMLVGMLKPTTGRITIAGVDAVKNALAAKAVIGYIPDRPYLYDKLTAMEFLHFVGGLFSMDGVNIDKLGAELLTMFELGEWSDELVENFSHGMKQRLIMSAALLHRPKVLIIDEPMVGLDPKGARLVKRIFRQLAAAGRTVFMSTHTLEIAEEVCDRIAIINKGQIIAEGTMDELRSPEAAVDNRLESIFLDLTGGYETAELVSVLKD